MGDRVAVVTGASAGLGRAVAIKLSGQGYRMVLLDIDDNGLRETATECHGTDVLTALTNTGDTGSVDAAAKAVEEHFGRCDVLVNNAGILRRHSILGCTDEEWDETINVNLTGYFRCIRAFAPMMVAQGGGSIVNVASTAAGKPTPGAVAYAVSKAAITALTRQITLDLGFSGVRANTVSPGFMDTPMTSNAYDIDGLKEARGSLVPVGRVAEPSELAEVIAFLASDAASYVSGQELIVDGGFGQTLSLHVPRPRTVGVNTSFVDETPSS